METSEELEIIKDYEENGIAITKLARKYHHNARSITAVLDKYNISHERGKLERGRERGHLRKLTAEEIQKVCSIYSNGGTTHDCCVAVHCNQDIIREVLKENKLYKTHAEAVRELPQNQVQYPIDEDFFFTQSSNLAYVLGFWASDGYVSKDSNEMALTLQTGDREILEKLHDNLGGRPLKDYVSKEGYYSTKWSFCSQAVKKEFATYGIIPQKTFKLTPPLKLDRKYWIDFIRGYFDGDGSVNYLQEGLALRWQICSATPEILEWMINFLYEEYHIDKVSLLTDTRAEVRQHPLYYFQYSTNATKKIHEILYTPNSWYLKRKKDAFDTYIELKK